MLDGRVRVRTPDGEHELAAGDIVCFAHGPDGRAPGHRRRDAAARVLMFSSAREPAVAVYPDSDKIGVWPGNDADKCCSAAPTATATTGTARAADVRARPRPGSQA